ncbi:hypothetical protein [Tomitella gaofuii]|uniref:hypothetical protein n=1 Tax=Tomitella gaofuii TaxID=2760083 RepID=UPI0015FBCF87|nr:hypothetical protein [Tomitella gaofuii]
MTSIEITLTALLAILAGAVILLFIEVYPVRRRIERLRELFIETAGDATRANRGVRFVRKGLGGSGEWTFMPDFRRIDRIESRLDKIEDHMTTSEDAS